MAGGTTDNQKPQAPETNQHDWFHTCNKNMYKKITD